MIWYKEQNPEIVISTRIRLARNLKDVPFPHMLKTKEEISKKIKDAVFNSGSTLANDFEDANLDKISDGEKKKLSEAHLLSPQMLAGENHHCLINKDKTMSLMIMEEDHIRQQVILGGYKLDEAYEICNKVDDVLSENLDFAFDEQLGYLTACPTNVGTGLRASVMLHLPALSMTGRIDRIVQSAGNVGIAVRGYYGEGSKAEGYFYQISNQITMGATEREIIERVKNVTDQIISFEKEARESILKNNKGELEDKVWRSYGILKYARKITSKEATSMLSDVLTGINMGIIKTETSLTLMELIVGAQPAGIGTDISPQERDIKRAEFIRDNL